MMGHTLDQDEVEMNGEWNHFNLQNLSGEEDTGNGYHLMPILAANLSVGLGYDSHTTSIWPGCFSVCWKRAAPNALPMMLLGPWVRVWAGYSVDRSWGYWGRERQAGSTGCKAQQTQGVRVGSWNPQMRLPEDSDESLWHPLENIRDRLEAASLISFSEMFILIHSAEPMH